MNKSDSIAKISPALLKAWANIGAVTKDAENPFFKSDYATLGAVMEVVKQPLLDQGIIILQPIVDGEYVETILLHESGEFISGTMRLVCAKPNDPQAMGSATTYNRRYGLQSMCFVPSVDDDAEKGMARQSTGKTPARKDPNDELQMQAKRPQSDW